MSSLAPMHMLCSHCTAGPHPPQSPAFHTLTAGGGRPAGQELAGSLAPLLLREAAGSCPPDVHPKGLLLPGADPGLGHRQSELGTTFDSTCLDGIEGLSSPSTSAAGPPVMGGLIQRNLIPGPLVSFCVTR